MSRRTRLRRTGILCMHVLRNLAFQRAMASSRRSWSQNQFWVTAHNNYLDIAVLEWCKLFSDRSGKHHWCKSITDQDAFAIKLQNDIGRNLAEYEAYALSFKVYRDKCLAHLDDANLVQVPSMPIAMLSTMRPSGLKTSMQFALPMRARLYAVLLNTPVEPAISASCKRRLTSNVSLQGDNTCCFLPL